MPGCRILLWTAVVALCVFGFGALQSPLANQNLVVAQKDKSDQESGGRKDQQPGDGLGGNKVRTPRTCKPAGTIRDRSCPNGRREYLKCSDGSKIVGECL